MKLPRFRTIILVPLFFFMAFYAVGAYIVMTDERVAEPRELTKTEPFTIAIFGASGTTGDGILKAALASDSIEQIYVVTRRVTPRISQGLNQGKVKLIKHLDYLDYSPIIQHLADIDVVYWAIGITSIGTDQPTYRKIHTDFPMQFLKEWTAENPEAREFQFISSSDISEDSDTMWIKEKIHAEKALFGYADTANLKVIAFRPDYIGPTDEEIHPGQFMLYWFFAPVGAAVKARQIGQAMIEVTLRDTEFKNGDKLSTRKIIRYSDAYEAINSGLKKHP